jgi:replicative DNA helicase
VNGAIVLHEGGAPGRLPPSNVEAEAALLGSALLDREVIGRVSALVEPRDFYRERHGVIFEAMARLHERNEPIDYLTLISELDQDGRLELAGGVMFLSELLSVVPTPVHADHYARLVATAATMRRLISVGGKIAEIGFSGQGASDTAIERAEQLLFDVARKGSGGDFLRLSDALTTYLDDLTASQSSDQTRPSSGTPSGFMDLDRIVPGGFQRSNLIVLAARPGMGKTSLSLAIAANAAEVGAKVAIFSLEMSTPELVGRLLSMQSGIEVTRLRSGHMNDNESRKLGRALGRLAEAEIYLDDTPNISVTALRTKARRLDQQIGLDLIIVDHLQLVEGKSYGQNRVQEVSDISRQLKGLARDRHVPVILLSQLSRAVEQRNPKIPVLSDLRDSGAIEQDADLVIFIYRDDYYNRDSEKQGIADLHIAKHRNGSTGQVSLLFNARTTRFLDLEAYQ